MAYGLTDEQARSRPTVSELSIGGLIKHATGMQRTWMARVAAAPDAAAGDPRPFDEVAREYAEQHLMRPDETLDGLLATFEAAERRRRCIWSRPPTWTPKCLCHTKSRGSRRISRPGRCDG